MSTFIAYISVILIWSTTPLAIKWSNDSLAPIAAVSLRMLLAAVLGLLIVGVWRKAGRLQRKHCRSYFLASISIFPTMPLVYYSAQYISSGLIAVLFGLMPLLSALFAYYLLGERTMTWRRVGAQLLALAGLVLISISELSASNDAEIGVVLSLVAVVIYCWCNVRLKKMGQTLSVPAFEQTVGALLFSLPGLFLCWYWVEGSFAIELSHTSAMSVLYLATVGALIGFVAFFLILERLSVSLISVIPVITPLVALWLGVVVDGETVSPVTLLGAVMIIVGLILYEGILVQLWRFIRRTKAIDDKIVANE